MKLLVDTHTHTISSGHAYSTVREMAVEAARKGLQAFAMTDHGTAMKGAPYLYHFGNLKAIPAELHGVRVIRGVEANIVDRAGGLDLPDTLLARLEFVMAGFHDICMSAGTLQENTEAMVGALRNPNVHAVSHPGNPQFPVDIDCVVRTAKEFGKLIEVNNHSFNSPARPGSESNCRLFALRCAELGVGITVGSDAHIDVDVGRFEKALALLDELSFPEELVASAELGRFERRLQAIRQSPACV